MPGMGLGQRHDFRPDHFQIGQGRGQGHGFVQRGPRHTAVAVGFDVGVQNPGPGHTAVMFFQLLSSPSYRLIGWAGMMVEIACL